MTPFDPTSAKLADDDTASAFDPSTAKPVSPLPAPAQPTLKRSLGEVAKDTGLGITQGAGYLLSGTAELLNAGTGGLLDKGVKAANAALTTAITGADFDPSQADGIAEPYAAANAAIDKRKSPVLRRKQQELADTKGFFASAGKVLTDPALAGQFLAEQVPNLALMGAGAGPTLARGVAAAEARGLAGKAAVDAGRRSLERQIVLNEAMQEAGPAAQQARAEAKALPEEVWAQNPEYVARVQAGEDPAAVKEAMATWAAGKAALVGGAAGALGGKLTAPLEGRLFTRAALGDGKAGLVRTMGTTALKEAGEEAIQEGGNQLGANVGVQGIDPSRGLMEGVPESAGTGAALGGLLGGGMAGVGHLTQREPQQPVPTPTPEATPGAEPALQRALPPPSTITVDAQGNATPNQPAPPEVTGDVTLRYPQGRGMATPQTKPFPGAPAGSLSAVVNDLTPGAPMPGNGQPVLEGEATRVEDALPPPPPNVDPATGEVVPWTREQIKGYLAAQLDIGRPGALPKAGIIASVYGLKPREANEIRQEVIAEGKANALSRGSEPARAQDPAGAAVGAGGREGQPAAAPVHPPGSLAEAADTTAQHAATAAPDAGAVAGTLAPADTPAHPRTTSTATAEAAADAAAPGAAPAPSVPATAPAAPQGSEVPAASAEGSAVADQDGVTAAAHAAATSPLNDLPQPTEAQKEAGNYKKGHLKIAGLDISVENPAGSQRRPEWPALAHHYGYIKQTIGKDKDHVDVFMGERASDTSLPVFVVDQVDPKTGAFDEHKVILGAQDADEARAMYRANYSADWQGDAHVTGMTHDEFEAWARDPQATQRPAAEALPERAVPGQANIQAENQAEDLQYGAAIEDEIRPRGKKPAFKKAESVTAELAARGLNPDDYTVTPADGGYIGVRKAAAPGADLAAQADMPARAPSPRLRGDYSDVLGPDAAPQAPERVTRKGAKSAAEEGFSSPEAALEALKKAGHDPADYMVKRHPGAGGYIAERRPAAPAAEPKDLTRAGLPEGFVRITDAGGTPRIVREADWAGTDETLPVFGLDGAPAMVKRKQDKTRTQITVQRAGARAFREAPKTSTAPEHIGVEPEMLGATDADIAKMGKAFDEYRKSKEVRAITRVFDDPKPAEVVDLHAKAGVSAQNVNGVRVYRRDKGWMTLAEARAEVKAWKERARAQGEDASIASDNSQRVVLSFFDLTGEWSRPWEEAGYQVYRFDIQDDWTFEYEDPDTGEVETRKAGDINNLDYEFFVDMFGHFEGNDVYAILAANPCTDFTVSGAKHFAAKDADGRTVSSVRLVQRTLAIIEHFKPPVWAMENPTGRIGRLNGLPPARLSFDPFLMGDDYTKDTRIWGRFNADLLTAPVTPNLDEGGQGSKMHRLYGGKSIATKNARSETPEGFSYAFFLANNAHDNPIVAVAGKYDRLDRALLQGALDAGLTPEEIDATVEDYYYQDLDDAAAEDALREAIAERKDDAATPEPLAKGDPVTVVRGRFKGRAARVTWASSDKVSVTFTGTVPASERGNHVLPRGEVALAAEPRDGAQTTARKDAERVNPPAQPTAGDKVEAAAEGQPTTPPLLDRMRKAVVGDTVDADGRTWVKHSPDMWHAVGGDPVANTGDRRTDHGMAQLLQQREAKPDKALLIPRRAPNGGTAIEVQPINPAVSANTIFTEDAAEKARAILRAKLGGTTLNSGLDPELMHAGLTLAGYHIEKGARTFAAFAQAMLADLGDMVRPYLKSWYMGVKYDPRASGFTGMDDAATVDAASLEAPAAPKGPRVIANEIGVDGLSASERAAGKAPYSTLSEAQMTRLEQLRDAVAGSERAEVVAARRDLDLAIEQSRRAESPQVVAGIIDRAADRLFRAFPAHAETATEVADQVRAADERTPASPDSAQTAPQETPDADLAPDRAPAEPDGVPAGGAKRRRGPRAAGGADRQSVDAGLAGADPDAAGSGDLFAGPAVAGEAGTRRPERTGDDAPGTPRDRAGERAESGPADFDLTDADIGTGGATRKYRDNLAAIRIVKALASEGRVATPEERAQLARYVGWGALKGVFDPQNKQWAAQHAELKALLTDAEWKAARASTRNAHFTSKEVVTAMVDGLQRLGFTRGRLLEPSVGVGNFFGLLPAKLRSAANLFGVELDPLTAKIAAGLYPSAKVANTGFEDYAVPGGFFDAAIGNPPFGEEPIRDSERSPYSGFSIHNYFFAKTIDKLRPGGLMLMVVSHNFLDAKDDRARRWIADRASLVAAVRLPRTAFKGNAGTEVVTDIVVFQKHDANGLPADDRAWVQAGSLTLENAKTGESKAHNVNRYFLANPDAVLGTHSAAGSMYGPNEYTVEPNGELGAQLKAWAAALPEGLYQPIDRTEDMQAAEVPDGIKVGSYFIDAQGQIQRRGEDAAGSRTASPYVAPNAKAEERLRGMIEVRDTLRQQMRLERDPDASEPAIEANRVELNRRYDAFLKAHGHLNSQVNRRLFVDDTDAPLLQSLEFDYDKGVSRDTAKKHGIAERPPGAVKADIFSRRVAFPANDMQHVSSAKDALVASLNYRGRVDLDYMAQVYDATPEAIERELGDLVFRTPEGGVVTADEYLSGDVKTKLAEAEAAAKADPAFARNVAALKPIIPADKAPSEIHVSLGAHFVPGPVMADFVAHITGGRGVVAAFVPAVGRWMIHGEGGDTVRLQQTWGTPHYDAMALIQASIDGKAVVVTKRIDLGGGKSQTVVLEAETDAARAKQDAIRQEWRSWLWRDAERGDTVLREYNEKMNRTVARKYDGRHLTLPGKGPGITLLEHQLSGIWRGVQSRQMLLDHVVGAGKTFQMVGIAMEMRRLGIARKPVFVVPNHLTLQWRSEFHRLYPGANVLAATPDDFSKDMRPKLFSKIVTGDWDAVILGHSSLKKIGLPAETEAAILQEQIDELAASIEMMKRERGDRNIIRDMEGIRKTLEAKAKERLAAAGTRDKVLTFDELGLDALFVDELHEFKNLQYTSTMTKVPGMGNPKGSARGFDLFVKTQWLFNTYGDQAPLITATGTPVSNSLVEMFNVQRYMQYPALKREGLHLFDSWARAYGSVENLYEVAPSGSGFRASSRFAKFQNLSSLMGHYLTFADVITLDDLKAQEERQIDPKTGKPKKFPVPKIEGGKPTLVVAKRSPQVAEFMGVPHLAKAEDGGPLFRFNPARGDVAAIEEKDGKFIATFKTEAGQSIHLGTHDTRADADMAIVEAALSPQIELDPQSVLGRFGRLRELTRATKGKVNALSLTGEANKAGLDYRLINPAAPDFAGSKINLAVANIVRVHKQWAADRGTQLVFCDMSVPLSAKSDMASKPKRAYVRDAGGELLHKAATLHTREGAEEIPYFIVTERSKSEKAAGEFAIYDAATGHRMRGPFANRGDARAWADQALATADAREAWLKAREPSPEIEQDAIDEYNDANEIDAEEVPGFTLQDIAGASSKFSVYDDMREKLIAKGIPEREIAFIHDYDSPAAKAKLFAAVNRGEVRVLFGSTPKLGAGTNVQKRAVALHHIDAPWRPSDLEQREGRVVRRGNELYERDPDGFAVALFRYATEQTYDARRWQILEHKARGIEQLRNYDGTLNEIEDIDGEAANAADMKAAASGDPLILKETQLRNDVKRLENLEVAHADNVVAARRSAAREQERADKYLPRTLRTLEELASAVTPAVEEGVPAASAVDGKTFTERKEFAQAIAREVGRFANTVFAERGVPTDFTIRWRGVDFTVTTNRLGGGVYVDAPTGELLHLRSLTDPFSATGLITRMTNYVERIPAHIAETQARIAEARSNAARFIAESEKPFADAAALAEARKGHKQVQRLLLLKGPDLPAADKPLLAQGLDAQRARLRSDGYGDTLDELLAAKGEGDALFSRPDHLGPGAWFKDSKVVNERGAPRVVYHGTGEEFFTFEDRAGEATNHPSSALGTFFTEDKPVAKYYAEVASKGVPHDEVIVDAYLSLQNPKRITLEDLQAFDNVEEARAFRAFLERQGYDGIHVPESGIWVAFKPNQIKSASQNNGDYDPANPDIRFSRPDATGRGMPHAGLASLVANLTRGWGANAPKVHALATADELPPSAKRSAGWEEAEGYYDERTGAVYLVAANLADAARARAVLLHETVGHYGMEAITGPALWAEIGETVRAMRDSGKHAGLFAEIGRRYVGANDAIFVREAVAVMAEKGVHNSVVDRVLAAMRRFLRSLGINLKVSEGDLRQMIVAAARYVRSGARPRVAPRALAGAFSQRPGVFYSGLLEAVERAQGAPKVADAATWAGWLDGAARRGEIRRSERDWIGVDAWLAGRGKTTRAELAAFIRANQVQVKDVVLGAAPPASKTELVAALEALYRDYHGEQHIPADASIVMDEWADGDMETVDVAIELGLEVGDIEQIVAGGDRAAKFASHQLPGGKDYRELLLTLPMQHAGEGARVEFADPDKVEDFLVDMDTEGYGDLDYGRPSDNDHAVEFDGPIPSGVLNLIEAYRGAIVKGQDTAGKAFVSHHFTQPNVLAHVRFNTRTDADGKRVLFLEEIQSDWHQAGRKRGYQSDGEPADYRVEPHNERFVVVFDNGTRIGTYPTREAAEAAAAERAAARSTTRSEAVPDAPFKATDEWAMLAFKRMVRWAAEHGFERIAWTTGEQQAARYDLSKQVESVFAKRTGEDRYELTVYSKDDPDEALFDTGGVPIGAAKLAEVVGKELADRIVADAEAMPWSREGKSYEGLDLKVGGEGMVGFYDGILPKAVNKWAKKFGGKVASAQVQTMTPPEKLTPIVVAYDDSRNGWRQQAAGHFYGETFPSRDAAQAEADRIAENLTQQRAAANLKEVHALDVTEAMREAALAGLPLFSRPDPASTLAAVDAAARGVPDALAAKARAAFAGLKGLKENTRPTWLGALTLRHLAELAGDIKLPFVGRYADRVQKMATDRNVMQDEAAAVAEPWETFQRQDRAGADATANLMHDTTIAGVDPAVDYRPLTTGTTRRGGDEPVTAEAIARRIALVEADMADTTGETARRRLESEIAGLRGLLAREQARQQAYPELVRRWLALPEEGRKVYLAARDAYRRQSEKLEAAILARIAGTAANDRVRQSAIAQIRQQFESARIEGPYFPLARFGDFWIAATAKDGSPFFSLYETVQEWRAAQAELTKAGMTDLRAGRKIAEARSVAGASGGFMADLEGLLEEAGVPNAIRDDVWQLFLRTLPELSMRKHSIHRKNTAGYSRDALRAFAGNMFHGSFQIARVLHTHHLEQDMLDLKRAVEAIAGSDPERAAKGAALASELAQRHDWIMNPRDSKTVSSLTGLGFAWYLGATPASALVNLTQTAIVTFPVLASRFGVGKAATALTAGMKRALRNIDGKLERGLSPEELQAFQVWRDSGALTHTSAHNLAGLSETDTQSFNPVARRAMTVVSWLFHHTEMVNREATALAAFRLAREAGDDFATATKYAEDVVTESHFDFTNANRARFMQSNAAKVLLLFRQYSLNMTWMLWRNAYLSLKGESPAVQKAARVKLGGILGMTGIFAGTLGLPLMSVLFGVANAAAAAFGGDDDDPFDAEVAFRNFLADLLGPAFARILTDGPVNALTGAEIGRRVSLNDLWLRDPDRELEGQAKADYLLEQAAGPVAGGMLVNTLRGMQQIEDGHTWRGVETMVPKAVKDAMKAIRYSTQGVNTLRGDPIIEDLGVGGTLLQLAGFSPASLTERYDANNAAKNYEQYVLDRRAALLDGYALAWRNEDQAALLATRDKILAFNQRFPELGITMATIRRSLESRLHYSARAEGGVVINPKLAGRARAQARFAEGG